MSNIYLSPPVVTDPDVLAANALAYLTGNVPGFRHAEGDLTTQLAAAMARMAAVVRDLASAQPLAIFRWWGQQVVGLSPMTAAFATMPTTWVAVDAAGYTIPAGTLVAWQQSGSQLVGFRTLSDTVIPPGSTSTAAGAVTVIATASGVASNAAGPGPLTLVDSLVFVASVTATAEASGGADDEGDASYISRLALDAQTLGPKPVTAGDYSIMARNVAGVTRALVLDGYNASTAQSGQERTVGIFAVDGNGNPVGAPVDTAIVSYFAALREVGFVITAGAPTYTTVNAAFTAALAPGADPTLTTQAAIAAVTAFLSPAGFAGGSLNPPLWNTGETVVRFLDVAAVIAKVWGVQHVKTLTLNGGTVDVALAGVAPLPQPGSVTGTVG